jgi:hypothetical protein
VNYEDPQSVEGGPGWGRKDASVVINPYVELKKMKLEIGELPALVPALADDNYLPTFSYWRDFHPDRTLHRVNWLVTEIVNDAAKRDLAEMAKFNALDEAGRKKHLDDIVAWCKANAGKTRAELIIATLKETKDWRQLHAVAAEAVQSKVAGAGSVLIERMDDFPKQRGELAELIYQSKLRVATEAAREWVKGGDQEARFWGALVLLRDGDKAKNEGFKELKAALKDDDGSDLYLRAIEPLVERKDEESLALACGILKKKEFASGFSGREALHHLILTGRPEVLEYLLAQLDATGQTSTSSGTWKGQDVSRELGPGDRIAEEISEWRNDHWEFESLAPDKERAAKREELKPWLKAQFALIREGKKSAFKAPEPIRVGRWQVDAP